MFYVVSTARLIFTAENQFGCIQSEIRTSLACSVFGDCICGMKRVTE